MMVPHSEKSGMAESLKAERGPEHCQAARLVGFVPDQTNQYPACGAASIVAPLGSAMPKGYDAGR
jgi:hypothetical protein